MEYPKSYRDRGSKVTYGFALDCAREIRRAIHRQNTRTARGFVKAVAREIYAGSSDAEIDHTIEKYIGPTQDAHLDSLQRMQRSVNKGRVRQFFVGHTCATISDAARELGLTRHTVSKYFHEIRKEWANGR